MFLVMKINKIFKRLSNKIIGNLYQEFSFIVWNETQKNF